jgi:hypothetical protein
MVPMDNPGHDQWQPSRILVGRLHTVGSSAFFRTQAIFRRLLPAGLLLWTVTALLAVNNSEATDLPDAPTPQAQQNTTQQPENKFRQTVAILGKRSVFFPELAHDKGPLDPRQKLELAVDETVAPSRFLGSMFTSGITQARDGLPGYGQGWSGYGKRFGSSVASNASNHLFGTFLLPSMLHQDPRYFVKVFGRPRSRILYAIERTVITRTDTGRNVFNWSGVLGGLMAESLANSYLPDAERTTGKTFSRYGIRIGFSALDNVVKEYWPTIFKSLGITKLVPSEHTDPGTVSPPVGPPAPAPQR